MTFSGGAPEKLRIGRVFSLTFDVIRQKLPGFLALALISAAPGLLLNIVQLATGTAGAQQFNPAALAFVLPLSLISLVVTLAVQSAMIQVAYGHLAGRGVTIRDALMAGFRMILPLLGLLILCGLAIMFGFALFFVPGVMLAVRWVVAGPAYVIEQKGVLGAMGRSADLTKGSRWRIFGLSVISIILVYAIEIGLLAVTGGFRTFANPGALSGPFLAAFSLGATLVSVVLGVVFYVGATVLYSELRRRKEGSGADVATVFE